MRLPHGYTNDSLYDGVTVTKHYRGADALARLTREAHVLRALAGHLPLLQLCNVDPTQQTLQTLYISARHGQELIAAGQAEPVLILCGQLLQALQRLPPRLVPGIPGSGPVIVHGDFGPQNILIAPGEWNVAALVDWEWAHRGAPVEDVAWAEWIVRMHHPSAIHAIPALFRGYGATPAWPLRHRSMLAQCQRLLSLAQSQQQPTNMAMWETRLRATAAFTEAP